MRPANRPRKSGLSNVMGGLIARKIKFFSFPKWALWPVPIESKL
jgi:hypothetical protein